MKRQFLHEDHNRQDKAKNPDYQEEMRLKEPTYTKTPDVEKLRERRVARESEIQRVKKYRFIVDGVQYKFGWSLEHFAKVNVQAVNEPRTREMFDKIRTMAEADMKDIAAAIMKGSVRQIAVRLKGIGRANLGILGVEWSVERIRCDEICR